MKLLLSWARDFVDITVPADAIAETMALRGFEVASVQQLDDSDAVIDFEVTANRPDCLSVIGLAREIATAYGLPMRDVSDIARRPRQTCRAGRRPTSPSRSRTRNSVRGTRRRWPT